MISGTEDIPIRGIHLPGPVSIWPPGPGWWWLLGTTVITLLIAFGLYKLYQSKAVHREINAEFERIREQFERDGDRLGFLMALSVLLRRSCISFHPRQQTAGLTGEQWLHFLDSTLPDVSSHTLRFDSDVGRSLLTAPYLPATAEINVDLEALLLLCETWLMAQPVRPRSGENV